ncbi:MAG: PIG-L family deacetylase [Candidatus Heimdallarchaeota archaeon]
MTDLGDDPVEVVAVGAHPDDVELTLGGVMHKLSSLGIKAGIVDLTNAEPTPLNEKYRSPDDYDPDYAENRLKEAQDAARILGVERITLDLPNRCLIDNFEARCKLAAILRRWRPKVVMTIFGRTLMLSPDHYQAQAITEAAIFYSRLTKWDKYFDQLPVHRVKKLFFTPVDSFQFFPGSFLVDISEYAETKWNAILAYKSQFQNQGNYEYLNRYKEVNETLGSMIGVDYAEPLYSPDPLRIDDAIEKELL